MSSRVRILKIDSGLCDTISWGHVATLKLLFEAPNESIFDRLDIFSDATNVENTLMVFFASVCSAEKKFRCPEKSVSLQSAFVERGR